jgi:hypothetical protein
MTRPRRSRRRPRPLGTRWAERELFFWTARQILKLIVLAALTVYFVVSLLKGRFAGLEHLVALLDMIVARIG